MAEYKLTKKAVQDLSNIWIFTKRRWSEEQADSYYKLLVAGFGRILKNPVLLGRSYSEVLEGLRGYKVGRHLLFYIIHTDGDILIVRILHESMDIPNRFHQ